MVRIPLAIGALLAMHATFAQTEWQPTRGHTQLQIWPGAPPDAVTTSAAESAAPDEDLVAGRTWLSVKNVSRPTITIYSPRGANTGAAIMVLPGGGYKVLAIDLEGSEVCDWLVSRGITCVLLKYRVPDSGPHWENECKCAVDPRAPMALEDVQRALGLVRHQAAQLHVDPRRVGVLGFSAGGHLVADISTHWRQRAYTHVDGADAESCRPDFAVALYPGHMLEKTTRELQLNPTIPVSRDTPPTFLLQSEDDPVDSVDNSLVYYIALKNAGVPVEYHVYPTGGHAFGLRTTPHSITHWPALVEVWLRSIGMLTSDNRR